MINYRKHIVFLFLSVIFFLLSYYSDKSAKKDVSLRLNVKRIESKIRKADIETEKLLKFYAGEIKKNISVLKDKSSAEFFKHLKIEQKKNFTVLIYQNDSLKFWTDNSFPASFSFSASGFENSKVIRARNGWYRIKTADIDGFRAVALYRIKNNFFYENKYLKNTFSAGIDLPSSVIVSLSPMAIGKNIKDTEGNYLFSLIPSNNITDTDKDTELPFFLFITALIFLMLFFNSVILSISYSEKTYLPAFIILPGLFVFFAVLIIFNRPSYLSGSGFFSEELFSGVFPFDRLADIIFISIFAAFSVVRLFDLFPLEKLFQKFALGNKIISDFLLLVFLLTSFWLFIEISVLFKDIILNSKMSFDIQSFIKPDIYKITIVVFTTILYLSLIFFTDSFIKLAARIIPFGRSLILSFSAFTLSLLSASLSGATSVYFALFTMYALILIILFIRYTKDYYSYFSLLALIFVFTVFSAGFITDLQQQKEKAKQKELIKDLTNDRDPVAESFLREINLRLKNDTILINKITNVSENQDLEIYDYLKRKYFYGFWEKYDLEISLCGNTEFYRKENQAENCSGYYNEELKKFGHKIENTNFWLMHYNTGKITYFGIINVPTKKDLRHMSLYITLSEKLTAKTLGYPALLIDRSTKSKNAFKEYSYAKYSKGILAVKFGKFSYELTDKRFRKPEKPEYELSFDGYTHLVYAGNKDKLIVLSKKKKNVFDNIISFVYLFVFFNALILVIIFFYDWKYVLKRFKFNFLNKIRFSMLFILFVAFVLFGSGAVYFTVQQNKKVNNREMEEKVQSVLTELKHKLQYEDELTPEWHTEQYDHLDELLHKFSEVFFSDINLYDLNGRLLGTSRSEIFNRGLLGKEMNPVAYQKLVSEGKTEYIQKEKIGKMEFLSIYIPLRNETNKIIAFINLPYFSDSNAVKKNISDIIMTTVNLYLVLFLLTALLSMLISSQITKPLTLLQSSLKTVQIGKKHKEIAYNRKDEIGALVKEYNLMVSKLEESARKLAESERESAWREMAKQIAHEIKNPLTPMKLSIQLLQKTWYDKTNSPEDFEKRLDNVTETLIEQINTLSAIASEFSAFAKMPKARKEEVEIVQKLKNVAALFENEKNIEIILNLNNIEELYIIADKEQISRVFINLIKNAVQAIPPHKKGKITITLEHLKNKVRVTVEDNGEGIPEEEKKHLFEPNFTTKTTGTGIGLAIVKNIINAAGGDISFVSEENKGTKFFAEFLPV